MPKRFKDVMTWSVALSLAIVLLAACSSTATSSAAADGAVVQKKATVVSATPAAPLPSTVIQGKNVVGIENFNFVPQTLTVAVGTTVTWVNHDDIPHLVVSTVKKFTSQPLDTDDHFAFRFTQPGTYNYFCGLHPKMTATIIVQ